MTDPEEQTTIPSSGSETHNSQHRSMTAQTLMEEARARKAFFTLLVLHLQQSADPLVQQTIPTFYAPDRLWVEFERWYDQRQSRRILRRMLSARLRTLKRQEQR